MGRTHTVYDSHGQDFPDLEPFLPVGVLCPNWRGEAPQDQSEPHMTGL